MVQKKWCRGYVLENDHAKLVREEFEYNFRKMTLSRRPDLILVDKEKKILWICDMACLKENNTVTKRDEKRTKYRQLAFEWRERNVILVVIGAFGGGIKEATHEVKKIFKQDDLSENIVRERLKTILIDGETIIQKLRRER